MRVEKDSEWVLPANLKRAAAADEGLYAAHKAYATGEDRALIEPHAIVDDAYAGIYARGLAAALKRLGLGLGGRVLDVGCAAGTITSALRAAADGTECHGIDLSRPLIGAARKTYSDCRFSVCSADELDRFDDGYFDLIHAREFYPFTRSASAALHWHFLDVFARKLRPGGIALAVQIVDRLGLADSLAELRSAAPAHGFRSISRHALVPHRLLSRIGAAAYGVPLYPMVTIAGHVLEILRPGRMSYLYLFRT